MPKVLFCRETLWSDANKLSTQYYAEQFAADGWDVLWLTRPLSMGSFLRSRWAEEKRAKLALWRCGGKRVSSNVLTYAPLTILPYRRAPILDSQWVAKQSLRFTLPPIRKVLQRLEFDKPDLLWFSDLAQASLIELIKPNRIVFHVTDNYSAFPRAANTTRMVELGVASKSNYIFVTNPRLSDRFSQIRVPIYYLPHGVVAEYFLMKHEMPKEYQAIPTPRVIYVGALAGWMDWTLMKSVVEALPELSFVFIGRETFTKKENRKARLTLQKQPNVYFLGPCDSNRVPAYLQHATVGIIPFAGYGLKAFSTPMKLYEYLSAGLPIVSTLPYWRWIGVESEIPMRCATTADEFSRALREITLLAGNHRAEWLREGKRFASENSWHRRFERAMHILSETC